MRRAILVLVLLAAACTSAPEPTAQERGAGLPPLGPCPASSWKPEAPPPTASAKTSMVLLAVRRMGALRPAGHHLFGRCAAAHRAARRPGARRAAAHPRLLGERRQARTQRPRRRAVVGGVHLVGHRERRRAARSLLPRASPTRSMSSAWSSAPRRPGAAFIPRRPSERAPQVGDLICASRDGGGTTLDNLNRGAGHCDIVVEVRPGEVHAIGGNVGDSVTRSVFPLDATGFCRPYPPGRFSP